MASDERRKRRQKNQPENVQSLMSIADIILMADSSNALYIYIAERHTEG